MTPLQCHINNRSDLDVAKWIRRIQSLPRSVTGFVNRRLWPEPLRHMRWLADGIYFDHLADQQWEMKRNDRVIARSTPLEHLIGRIDRPVSIIASGPSAADYPWDTVRNGERILIAVNGTCTFLKQVGIQADLLVVTDTGFPSRCSHHFQNAPDVPLVTTCRTSSILESKEPGDLARRKFAIIERVNAWYGVPAVEPGRLAELNRQSGSPFHLPDSGGFKFKDGWSSSPELGFFSGCTVPFAALQVAVGLGATDVEIIGMDLSDQGRSYAESADAPPSYLQAQYDKCILPSFEIMHRALLGSGVSVRNLSPVCPLPPHLFATGRLS